MGFIYALAVVLVIFEGIIIQYGESGHVNGHGSDGEGSSNLGQDAEFQKPVEKKSLSQTELNKLNDIGNYTIKISHPRFCQKDGKADMYAVGDISFLEFGDCHTIINFFERYGGQVTKIHINLDVITEGYRGYFARNIFKKYACNLEELRITTLNDTTFWKEILDVEKGEEEINFRKMKKFQFLGLSCRKEFKLNLIFPELESLMLVGDVADEECLKNMKKLTELTLHTNSKTEEKLKNILEKDGMMSKITIMPPDADTKVWIKEHEKILAKRNFV